MTLLLICTFATVISCSTTTVTTDTGAVLAGRIYDENGSPLAGVELESGRFRGISDNFGRFRLDSLPRGERRVRVYKRGHETHSFPVILESPHSFVRVSLWSLDGLIDLAIACIRSNALEDAALIYRRCSLIDPADSRVILLKSILEGS